MVPLHVDSDEILRHFQSKLNGPSSQMSHVFAPTYCNQL